METFGYSVLRFSPFSFFRAKTNAELLQEIRLGLEDYERTVRRKRYSSICKLGFDEDVNISDLDDTDSVYSDVSEHSGNYKEKVSFSCLPIIPFQ